MEEIFIIHLTAGRSQQTVTRSVQSVSQTNDWKITHNSKLAPALLPADQIWPFVWQRFMGRRERWSPGGKGGEGGGG